MKIRRPVIDTRSDCSPREETTAFNEISEISERVGRVMPTKQFPFN
jgi:hypothetical protein